MHDPVMPQLHRCRTIGRGLQIFEVLEKPNWPPWLRFTAQDFEYHARVFPDGQILLCDTADSPVATLSTNHVAWSGRVLELPTWDDVAGDPPTYEATFDPRGNTIVLMSMSLRADVKGHRVTDLLIKAALALATQVGADYLIGDVRPNGFGPHKVANPNAGFNEYAESCRPDGLPIDHWLRAMTRKGMRPLRVDLRAMTSHAKEEAFERFRATYRPERWYRVTNGDTIRLRLREHDPAATLTTVDEVWECGETGTWYVDRGAGQALYVESNRWGILHGTPVE